MINSIKGVFARTRGYSTCFYLGLLSNLYVEMFTNNVSCFKYFEMPSRRNLKYIINTTVQWTLVSKTTFTRRTLDRSSRTPGTIKSMQLSYSDTRTHPTVRFCKNKRVLYKIINFYKMTKTAFNKGKVRMKDYLLFFQ